MTNNKYKVFGILPLFVAALLFLAGCGGSGGKENKAPAKDTSPIKIGFLVDKTGALASYGYAHEKVGKAAVENINKSGGVNGRPLELVIRDTESNPSVAAVQARRLIENEKVDFLLGSNTSAVVLAVAPIARELKTVYFGTAGGALLTTPGKGNRYVFDFNTNVKQETAGVVKFIKDDLKVDNWLTVVVDYAWGWDQEQSFAEAAKENGIKVVKQIRVPLGTDNWLRYLQNIPQEAKGVYFANFGTDFLAFIRDLHTVRPDLVKIGGNYVISGQKIEELGKPAEGLYVVTGYPTWATSDEYDLAYRKAIGMDDKGRETGSGKALVPSYQWSTWETLHAIRDVIIASGWTGKKDTPKFIQKLEEMKFQKSLSYPEGDKYFRPEDHLVIKGAWIEQIKDGKLSVVKRIPAETILYQPMINLPKEQPFEGK
ncbi:MAG: ABC transporter substrate-binding protein [Bacillota bacterium]